ncbi:MAG TPA: hypothetical protein ENN55_01975 [Firmicutes bacterium]|nr:hypothetical protein [Bacillota bacterium]
MNKKKNFLFLYVIIFSLFANASAVYSVSEIVIGEPVVHKLHGLSVKEVIFTSDSKKLVTCGNDGIINITAVSEEAAKKTMINGGPVNAAAISPDSRHLVTAGPDKILKIWDLKTGRLIKALEESTGNIRSISFSPSGRFFAAGGRTGVVFYRLNDYKKIKTLNSGGKQITSVDFSGDGKRFLSAYGTLFSIREIKDPGPIDRFFKNDTLAFGEENIYEHNVFVYSASFSPDSYFFVISGEKSFTSMWRSEDGLLMWNAMLSKKDSWDTAFTPDNLFILIGGGEYGIIMADIVYGQQIAVLHTEGHNPISLDISDNGRYIAAGFRDGTVKIWPVSGIKKSAPVVLYVSIAAAAALLLLITGIYYLIKFLRRKRVKNWEV